MMSNNGSYDVYLTCPSVISSAVAFTTCYALDTYKTRIQSRKNPKVLIKKSLDNLYQGYFEGVLMCCIIACVYFTSLQYLSCHMASHHASMCASFLTTCVKIPFKSVVKLLQNGNFSSSNVAYTFLLKTYGIKGFFRGFWAYALDDVPETVLKFYLFSEIQKIVPKTMLIFVGCIAGSLSSVVTQPLDVLQTLLICNVSGEKIDYSKVNYFDGMFLTLLINSLQSAVFLQVYGTLTAVR